MRNMLRKSSPLFTSLVALAIGVGIMVYGPALSSARVASTSITVTNNSGREIRHLYLSAPDQNNWGSDQLSGSVISPSGGSVTISASCDGGTIKVIAEDSEGCFSYQVVSCTEGASWTITNETARDCGN